MIVSSSSSGQDAARADATNSLLNPSLILLSLHVTRQVPPLWEHAVFTTFYCTPVKGGFLHVGYMRTEVLRAAALRIKALSEAGRMKFSVPSHSTGLQQQSGGVEGKWGWKRRGGVCVCVLGRKGGVKVCHGC